MATQKLLFGRSRLVKCCLDPALMCNSKLTSDLCIILLFVIRTGEFLGGGSSKKTTGQDCENHTQNNTTSMVFIM